MLACTAALQAGWEPHEDCEGGSRAAYLLAPQVGGRSAKGLHPFATAPGAPVRSLRVVPAAVFQPKRHGDALHVVNATAGDGAKGRPDGEEQARPGAGRGIPLGAVVEDAAHRWFQEAYQAALDGDLKMQALVGQMLKEGYGCVKNPELGAMWEARARHRNYGLHGVYDDS